MAYQLWSVIWFTLWQASLTTLLAIFLGGSLALFERATRAHPPTFLFPIFYLPVFLPPILVSTSFIQLFSGSSLLYTPTMVVLAHLYYNIPLAYLAIHSALQAISFHTEESARVLGANNKQLFLTLWWPQLKPTILGVAGIIFLYCITSFALPLQLGGIHAQTLEVWLYQRIILYHDYNLVGWITGLQTVIFSLVILLIIRPNLKPQLSFTPPTIIHHSSFFIHFIHACLAIIVLTPLAFFVFKTISQTNLKTLTLLTHSHFFLSILWTTMLASSVIITTLFISLLLKSSFKISVLLLTLSPVTLGFIWLLILGQSKLSLWLALVIGLVPITNYFIAQSYRQLPEYFHNTAKILGANYLQQYLLEINWLKPTISQVISLGIAFVFGDIALASLLAPNNAPTSMQVAFGLLSSYHFQVGSLALVCILGIIFITICSTSRLLRR
ncbi:MAG: ABC transporter permease subunit [Patescibacteria group bacterium]